MSENQSMGLVLGPVIRLHHNRMHALLAEIGLCRGQPPIMHHLRKSGVMSQKDLASTLGLAPATVTVTLKRMEKAGLLTRETDPGDKRVQLVRLSPQGARRLEQADEVLRQVEEESFQGFTPKEKAELYSYLMRVAKNLTDVGCKGPCARHEEK